MPKLTTLETVANTVRKCMSSLGTTIDPTGKKEVGRLNQQSHDVITTSDRKDLTWMETHVQSGKDPEIRWLYSQPRLSVIM